eukprot:CAMPEP_0203812984 /NCGR_PEP_ID=MMETSP0115-20131106/4467_1 /ASSEMBLY_ACC=CAM_ASM_000227 /TAXON_ID=33651 /ORGANISM="Bicosoecid sp, Strain ms1" /LENGTH=130 /DNA_ID=CAMNT_0050721841 /DNA_START=113 /DNA_END=503 /DNA_ORIENTATION=-
MPATPRRQPPDPLVPADTALLRTATPIHRRALARELAPAERHVVDADEAQDERAHGHAEHAVGDRGIRLLAEVRRVRVVQGALALVERLVLLDVVGPVHQERHTAHRRGRSGRARGQKASGGDADDDDDD